MNFFLLLLIGSVTLYTLFALFFLIGLIRLSPTPKKNTANPPTVSVIVAARNEAEHLPGLLQDLARQDYPVDKLEIVIADDRSTDRTWSLIQEYNTLYNHFSGVRITERSPAMTSKKQALTQALKHSRGEIVVTTDGDCRVPPTWVSSMVSAFNEDTGIVIGYSRVDTEEGHFFTRYQNLDFLSLMAANAGSLGWGAAWSGSGQNLAYRRVHFDSINGFEPVAERLSGDDFYLVQSISKIAGAVFNASPDGFVKTAPVPTLYQYLNQRIRWSSNVRGLVQENKIFFLFLISAFLCNLSIFIGLFTSAVWSVLPLAFSIKFVLDALVIFSGANRFRTMVQPLVFISWSLLQPIYIPVIGLLGLGSKFRWKE